MLVIPDLAEVMFARLVVLSVTLGEFLLLKNLTAWPLVLQLLGKND